MKLSLLRLAAVLLCALLLAAPAFAEDVCVVQDASSASAITTGSSYLRVRCPLNGAQPVTMTVRDAWGYLLYQRNYGLCNGSFCSEDVYLHLEGSRSDYTVTIDAGSASYSFRVTREQPRLTDSGVYAAGIPLSQISGSRSYKQAVIIDADALEGSTLTVPLVSGGMEVGYANFSVRGGALNVSAMLTVDGTIEKSTVYVARDAVTAQTLGTNHFIGDRTKLNRSIDLRGTPYAAVVLQLTISYDAGSAVYWNADPYLTDMQVQLWQLMQLTTASDAVG